VLAEKLAHEENQVQVLRLFLRSVRVILRVGVCESIGHDIEEELKTVPRDIHFGTIEGLDKLITIEIAVTALIGSSQRLLEHHTFVRECKSTDLL